MVPKVCSQDNGQKGRGGVKKASAFDGKILSSELQ